MKTIKIINSSFGTQAEIWEKIEERAKEENATRDFSEWDQVFNDAERNEVYFRTFKGPQGERIEICLISAFKKMQSHKNDTIKHIIND